MKTNTKHFTIGLLQQMHDDHNLVIDMSIQNSTNYYFLFNSGIELPMIYAIENLDGSLQIMDNPMISQILQERVKVKNSEYDMLPRFFDSKILQVNILDPNSTSDERDDFRKYATLLTPRY